MARLTAAMVVFILFIINLFFFIVVSFIHKLSFFIFSSLFFISVICFLDLKLARLAAAIVFFSYFADFSATLCSFTINNPSSMIAGILCSYANWIAFELLPVPLFPMKEYTFI